MKPIIWLNLLFLFSLMLLLFNIINFFYIQINSNKKNFKLNKNNSTYKIWLW